jgi:hypothetical protein
MDNQIEYLRETYTKVMGPTDANKVFGPTDKWLSFDVRPLLSGNTGDHRDVIAVNAEPGNGTSYRMVLTRLTGAEDLFGCQDGAWLLSMDPYWKAGTMTVKDLKEIHPSYIQEKLRVVNEHDAAAIAAILFRVAEKLDL